MNYRHAFHAGNFADVFKHAVLTRILVHLCEKAQAFRVIDTHAGAGLYDLTAASASRTGEWRDGIGRLIAAAASADEGGAGPIATFANAAQLLTPYLSIVRAANRDG